MRFGSSLFLALLFAGSAFAGDMRFVVVFKAKSDAAVVRKHGATADAELLGQRAMRAHGSAAAIAKLRNDPDVASVEEDGIAEAIAKPEGRGGKGGSTTTPPPQTVPWGVARVSAPLSGNTGAGITVAVIDTGCDLDHPDLAANIAGSVDFTGSSVGADDQNGHGSHVAGTIAAVNNAIGYIGCAPDASLLAVRTLDRRGSGFLSDVADGITWAASHGAQIANMSLGGPSASYLQTACDNAQSAGVLLIAAAGNSGDGNSATTETSYPAAYGSVVAVGATSSSDTIASFSNSGPYLEVSGPGVSVPSTYKNGGYNTLSGTSMACPHAVGVAALIWREKLDGGQTANQSTVRNTLHTRVRDKGPSGWDAAYGYGIVDFAP